MRIIRDAAVWAAEMQEKSRKRQSERVANGESVPVLKMKPYLVSLPLWPDVMRGVPNGVLRSALFGAIKRGPRRYMKSERITALEGIDILYTGERLDQGDLDVWETVLHIARLQEMGTQCRFTAYAMLKLLGKTDTGSNRETLHSRLIRLKANALEVKQGRFTYVGSLIDEVFRDDISGEYVIALNAKLRPLFGDDQFTKIDWNVRHALSGKPLAQWLHGFYASHAQPFPLKASTLLALAGSENSDAHSAGQALQRAFDFVTHASNINGQPFSYEIKNDLVKVDRKVMKKTKK